MSRRHPRVLVHHATRTQRSRRQLERGGLGHPARRRGTASNAGPPSGRRKEPPAASSPPPPEPPKRTQIGTFQDWVDAYYGAGPGPELGKRSARLGTLAAVPRLPRATLFYRRHGHLVRAEVPALRFEPLSHGDFWDGAPKPTRDGRWVFFESTRGGARAVYRMRPDGSGVEQVLDRGAALWVASDDGEKLAHFDEQPSGVGELYARLRVREGGVDTDVYGYSGWGFHSLTFARDGKALFWVEGGFDDETLKRADLEARTVTALPRGGYHEFGSPWDLGDGRLLFVASPTGALCCRTGELYTMPVTGGAWSVDPRFGRWSVSSGTLYATVAPSAKRVALEWIQRLGGFGADYLTDVFAPRRMSERFPRPFYSATQPSWAPDSRHLAMDLYLRPYRGDELALDAIVLADADTPGPLAFLDYGDSPAFIPR